MFCLKLQLSIVGIDDVALQIQKERKKKLALLSSTHLNRPWHNSNELIENPYGYVTKQSVIFLYHLMTLPMSTARKWNEAAKVRAYTYAYMY